MDCLALGDEYAVRLASIIGCRPRASFGRSAFDQAALMRDTVADRVLISLGNHPSHYRDPNLLVDMLYVRSKVRAPQVMWILPSDPEARDIVRLIARKYGDILVEIGSAF